VFDRALHRRGIYPPIAVLPSLSRLMSDGIGADRTRADHPDLARQLYAVCARATRARSLESIVGRDELSSLEQAYLAAGEHFEHVLLAQSRDEHRSIANTLDRGWDVLRPIPRTELTRLPESLLAQYLGPVGA
jgi:V/A-type H+-transporting ATPase subunit B